MKNQMKKIMTTTIMLLGLAYAQVSAATGLVSPLVEGSFKGRNMDYHTAPVHFIVKELDGTKGSYIAILIRGKHSINVFQADPEPTLSNTYKLFPLVANSDGQIGPNSVKPSLELSVVDSSPSNFQFNIVPTENGNSYGIQGKMRFLGFKSSYEWKTEVQSGWYGEQVGQLRRLSIGEGSQRQDDPQVNAAMQSLLSSIPTGTIQSQNGGLFTVKRRKIDEIQARQNKLPDYIGFFIKRHCSKFFVLIDQNPNHYEVIFLRQK